jgi:predicted TIM-barrel fold metal-dependent hydrolase
LFSIIIKICRYAEQKKLIICIDGSYGTSKMYSYNNMKLACCVADFISKTPIVIVHAGGARIIEAMLLAADKSNVWLDTSFSLPYYLGSSIEVDFDFAIKKLKFDKIIFGSDHPYIVFEEALNKHLDFFARHNFKDCEISKIMGENALKLFNV